MEETRTKIGTSGFPCDFLLAGDTEALREGYAAAYISPVFGTDILAETTDTIRFTLKGNDTALFAIGSKNR